MVDARSYQQMSENATEQQQYMMQADQDQYQDEFGQDMMMNQMHQQQIGSQDDQMTPINALVSDSNQQSADRLALINRVYSFMTFDIVQTLEKVYGFNKDIDQGVHFLTEEGRTVSSI